MTTDDYTDFLQRKHTIVHSVVSGCHCDDSHCYINPTEFAPYPELLTYVFRCDQIENIVRKYI